MVSNNMSHLPLPPTILYFNHLHADSAFLWNGSQFSCYIRHCVMLVDELLLYMYQRVFASFTSSKRTGGTARWHSPLILLTCNALFLQMNVFIFREDEE
jgi:hypothetical protein